ncbi:MAG: hypothetical protein R3254_05020, partial [Thiomicrorhabdus sp.]|nr:hypothetical protein [Thiomicrorhabdus sp.]
NRHAGISRTVDIRHFQRLPLALSYLATELNQIEAEQEGSIDSIKWFSWCADGTQNDLAEQFESLSSRKVLISKKHPVSVNKNDASSNVDELFHALSTCDAIKAETSKPLFQFERALPWVAGLVLAVSAGAFLAGLNWQKSAEEYMASTESLMVSSQYNAKLMKAKQLVAQNSQTSAVLEEGRLEFIEQLYVITESNSIPQIVADLQSSVNKFIHVNHIQLHRDEQSERFGMIVQGFVDQDLDFASKQVQMFIERLVAKGYQIEDKGFVAKNGNNGFQLILIPGNKE